MATRRKSTRKGMRRKTRSSRRAYRVLPSSKKKIEGLERSNKALRARLAKARGGNPMPHGPLKSELAAYSWVAAGGGMSGWVGGQLARLQAQGTLPAFPAGIRAEWAATALLIAVPALGYVKGANAARMALVSSGMAAAQLSDFLKEQAIS